MTFANTRAILRRLDTRPKSSLAGFLAFLEARKVPAHYSGRRPPGARTMTQSHRFGPFGTVTFRHPTKKATRGRISTVAFAVPQVAA